MSDLIIAMFSRQGSDEVKHQYFGDINDYRKYGLLRALHGSGDLKILVTWMLTSDDGGRDGRRRSYLGEPDRWRKHDPLLFDGLAGLVRSARRLDVSLIEQSGLLHSATYHRELVPDLRSMRDSWRNRLLVAAAGVDLVFFDPDNGVEIASRPVGRKGSSKYVSWNEIEGIWAAGSSVLVYQHFPRRSRNDFIIQGRSLLRERTGACLVQAYRTPHVLFLLAAQKRHADRFREVARRVRANWIGQIEPVR
jgi:hypothetical protein